MRQIFSTSDLGKAIRVRRRELGYTQSELADMLGIGVTYISNIENGKETAEIGKALRIVQMLGMDLFVERRGRG
ncbi:MAG: helix-turn-helix domain-containing protein [Atopobiaceae bacterium]